MKHAAFLLPLLAFHGTPVLAQIMPAPEGEPTMVAQREIQEAHGESLCPLVVDARRLRDGSIKAVCNNQEDFRIFTLQGTTVAMKCSAARAQGISGC